MKWDTMRPYERAQNLVTLFSQTGFDPTLEECKSSSEIFVQILLGMIPHDDDHNLDQVKYWNEVIYHLNK